MSVTSVTTDEETLTLAVIADFAASIDQVWQLWADPRKLEKWWGPPTHPATVEKHDLTTGGDVTYFMTAPDGQQFHGWWRVVAVDPPTSLELLDGFADDQGRHAEDMPTMRMTLAQHGEGTRMELRSVFEDLEGMQKQVAMGMVEGMTEAVNQIDAILAA